MPGLLESLTNASRSLTAQRLGIDVAGQNLANINTDGYARRSLRLAEVPPGSALEAGRGVEVLGIRSQRDDFIEARLRREQSGAAEDQAVADSLSVIEAAMGLPGASLDERLTSFFASFSFLANDVTSVPARDAVLQQGQALAGSFHDLADRFASARRDADQGIITAVGEINTLAASVARLNSQIIAGGPQTESLTDQRNVALAQLAELADVGVQTRADGAIDVTLGSGRALVIGADSYTVSTVPAAGTGLSSVVIGGYDTTADLQSGRIGGLLEVRDTLVPAYISRLDQLAYDVATGVNALHATGYDATGAAAGNFFAAPAAVAGAAAALAVDPDVVADTQKIAGSSTGTAGDNQTATAIADLHDGKIALGSTATPVEAWGQLVYTLGSDSASARASVTGRDEVVRQLQRLRDESSGVSLDEEAANLIRYQRAYEANARYFAVISDTLDTLISLVR